MLTLQLRKHCQILTLLQKRGMREKNLRSLGIKTSTTFPYLSNRGNKSSAVVPVQGNSNGLTDSITLLEKKKKRELIIGKEKG